VSGPQGDEPDAAVVEFGEHGLGGELGVEDQQCLGAAGEVVPLAGERDDLTVWLALDRSALA
jgi:hypothetical protein